MSALSKQASSLNCPIRTRRHASLAPAAMAVQARSLTLPRYAATLQKPCLVQQECTSVSAPAPAQPLINGPSYDLLHPERFATPQLNKLRSEVAEMQTQTRSLRKKAAEARAYTERLKSRQTVLSQAATELQGQTASYLTQAKQLHETASLRRAAASSPAVSFLKVELKVRQELLVAMAAVLLAQRQAQLNETRVLGAELALQLKLAKA